MPAAASAHANLVSITPADRAVLARAPERVVVRFDDDVRVAPGNAAVRNGDGSILGGKPTAHGTTLVLPLRTDLGQGDYSVRWSAVSDDGHVVQGVIAFGVGLGRPPPVPTSAHGRGRLGPCSRWVFFAGLLVARDLRCSICSCGGRSRRAICERVDRDRPRAMFVSSHGLVHASHGGASTRFGLAIYIGSGSRPPAPRRRRSRSPTGRRAVRGRARGRRPAGADRCGARARSGPVVARSAHRSPARDRCSGLDRRSFCARVRRAAGGRVGRRWRGCTRFSSSRSHR